MRAGSNIDTLKDANQSASSMRPECWFVLAFIEPRSKKSFSRGAFHPPCSMPVSRPGTVRVRSSRCHDRHATGAGDPGQGLQSSRRHHARGFAQMQSTRGQANSIESADSPSIAAFSSKRADLNAIVVRHSPSRHVRLSSKKLGPSSSERHPPSEKLRPPSSELHSPSKKLRPPSSELHSPSKKPRPPSSELHSPSKKLRLPSSELHSPSKKLRPPSSELHLPSKKLGQSSSEPHSPSAKPQPSRSELEIFEQKVPMAELEPPRVDHKARGAGLQAPMTEQKAPWCCR
ncbi:hypothetical protein ABIC76_003095 [Ralstonia sp. 1138]